MSVSVPSDYFLRRVRETCAGQSTPLAQQVGASRSPLLQKHSLWTGSLLAPRDLWRRLLSVGTHPPALTYKANAGPGGASRYVGRLVRALPVRRDKLPPVAASPGGAGRLDDPLIRTVDAVTEQKYPVLLEYAKASFERIKQRLRHL